VTSGPRLVKPQATSALWPMITPGTPEKVKPEVSRVHASVISRQCRPICIQIPGWLIPRCGSLASSGMPVALCSPSTTHELLPIPRPEPTSSGRPFTTSCTRSSASTTPFGYAGRWGLRVPLPVAFCSNTPSTTPPPDTIGGCSANG